jgi:hypothetical protein
MYSRYKGSIKNEINEFGREGKRNKEINEERKKERK